MLFIDLTLIYFTTYGIVSLALRYSTDTAPHNLTFLAPIGHYISVIELLSAIMLELHSPNFPAPCRLLLRSHRTSLPLQSYLGHSMGELRVEGLRF